MYYKLLWHNTYTPCNYFICYAYKAELKVSDGSLFVQDRFEYGLADKQNAIEKSLEDAETVANKNDVFINFASTKGSLPVGHSYFLQRK